MIRFLKEKKLPVVSLLLFLLPGTYAFVLYNQLILRSCRTEIPAAAQKGDTATQGDLPAAADGKSIIGLGNNGDFFRMSAQGGIYYTSDGKKTAPVDVNGFEYVTRVFLTGKPFNPDGVRSSAFFFVSLSRQLNDWFHDAKRYDIRFIGFLYSVFALAAVFLMILYLKHFPFVYSFTGTFLIVFMLSDTGYFSYFNSFYLESASLVFLLFTVVAGLHLATPHRGPKTTPTLEETQMSINKQREAGAKPGFSRGFTTMDKKYLAVNLFFLSSALLFLTAKPQNSILFPVICGMWWLLTGVKKQKRSGSSLITGFLVTVIVSTVSVSYLAARPYKAVNLYNNVFHYICGTKSGNMTARLGELGLDRRYLPLCGTHWWRIPKNYSELRDCFVEKMNNGKILLYYMKNPSRFHQLLNMGSGYAFRFRPHDLGNFERSKGGPTTEISRRFSHLSNIKKSIYPKSLAGMLLVFLLHIVFTSAAIYMNPRNIFAKISLCLVLMAALQFVAVLLGEGNYELVKHLFLFNALVDSGLVFFILGLLNIKRKNYSSSPA
ncbi:MAG: hypothetical protein GY765_35200 [bacterium]|nr:hypothetical protein [bacterium]